MGIQKFVFFSIHNCEKHPEVPLMEIKSCTEKFIQDSGLTHITIRLCGFMQVDWNFFKLFTCLFLSSTMLVIAPFFSNFHLISFTKETYYMYFNVYITILI